MYNTLPCLAVPVYKSKNIIKIRSTDDNFTIKKLETNAIDDFVGNNKLSANEVDYVYTIKFSIVPPFKIDEIKDLKYTVDNDGDLKIDADLFNYQYGNTANDKAQVFSIDGLNDFYIVPVPGYSRAIINITSQNNINIQRMYDIGIKTTFFKNEIVGSERDIKYNPKLYGADFMSIKISDNTQNGAEYDIFKLGANTNINLIYTEALTPDITKIYLRASTNALILATPLQISSLETAYASLTHLSSPKARPGITATPQSKSASAKLTLPVICLPL
jgi:hypothetical protein